MLDRQVWQAKQRVLGQEHRHTLLWCNNLAVDVLDQGRYAEAVSLMVQVREAQFRRGGGADNPNTIVYGANLGHLRGHYLHRYAEGYPGS